MKINLLIGLNHIKYFLIGNKIYIFMLMNNPVALVSGYLIIIVI